MGIAGGAQGRHPPPPTAPLVAVTREHHILQDVVGHARK